MYKLSAVDKFSIFLILLGAINWGIIGLLGFNIINILFKALPMLEKLIYILVGVSAINSLLFITKCKMKS